MLRIKYNNQLKKWDQEFAIHHIEEIRLLCHKEIYVLLPKSKIYFCEV